MSAEPGPRRFEGARIVLVPDGASTTKPLTHNSHIELDGQLNIFARHILVMLHSFSEVWRIWEMHPMGDEIVVL